MNDITRTSKELDYPPKFSEYEAEWSKRGYEPHIATLLAKADWSEDMINWQEDEIHRLHNEIEAGGSRERGTSPNRSCGTVGQSDPASSPEPPAAPAAWQRVVDSAYEPGPRMQFSDSKNRPMGDGWEPLYTRPAPPPGLKPGLERAHDIISAIESPADQYEPYKTRLLDAISEAIYSPETKRVQCGGDGCPGCAGCRVDSDVPAETAKLPPPPPPPPMRVVREGGAPPKPPESEQ